MPTPAGFAKYPFVLRYRRKPVETPAEREESERAKREWLEKNEPKRLEAGWSRYGY